VLGAIMILELGPGTLVQSESLREWDLIGSKVGVPYRILLTPSGGVPPYQCSLNPMTLPDGLVVSGTIRKCDGAATDVTFIIEGVLTPDDINGDVAIFTLNDSVASTKRAPATITLTLSRQIFPTE
jgi:hypothetical protein